MIKNRFKFILSIIFTVIIGIALVGYIGLRTPKSKYTDLTVTGGYNLKGWTVYTYDNEIMKPLEYRRYPHYGFQGFDYPGQIFYMTRIIDESWSGGVLEVGTETKRLTVFLDGRPLLIDKDSENAEIGGMAYLKPDMDGKAKPSPVYICLPDITDESELTLAIQELDFIGEDVSELKSTVSILYFKNNMDMRMETVMNSQKHAFFIGTYAAAGMLCLFVFIFYCYWE